MTGYKWRKGSAIPSKPKRWRTNNGKISPQARTYLSYKNQQTKGEQRLNKKGMMSSGISQQEKDKQNEIIRVWIKFTYKHHDIHHLDIEMFAQGKRKDKYEMIDRLNSIIASKFNPEISETCEQQQDVSEKKTEVGIEHIQEYEANNQGWIIKFKSGTSGWQQLNK